MSKEEFLRYCKICGISSFDRPLRVYTDLDCRIFVCLCHDCEVKVLAKTGGELPLESLNRLGGGFVEWEEWEWEKAAECCGMSAQEQFDLCRGISLLSQL